MTGRRSKSTSVSLQKPQPIKGAKPRAKTSVSPATSAEPSGKLGKVVALLKRPRGATIADIIKVTDWQAHSVRGAISGAIKKKMKLTVVSEKVGNLRTYRIAS